ncbi:MAG: type II toxin-antitoxin system prevent-host-death family antitoxin [Micrococcales bacterium]|nr:type II toxin-antitoxin system prevent-host-death family antitoxin [Micrococcales bacterium]
MTAEPLPTISVGHLRQNPTQMLRQVQAGQTYVITNHGVPVAQVAPIKQHRWVKYEDVKDVLSQPETTGWAEDLRKQRAETDMLDPWDR